MSLNFLFNTKANQNRKAFLYSMELNDDDTGNFVNINNQVKSFAKVKKEFVCGIYEGRKTFNQNITDGLNTEGSSLVLFTNDTRVFDILKKGDKVVYEDDNYSIQDITTIKSYKNAQYQRYTSNKYKLIVLT